MKAIRQIYGILAEQYRCSDREMSEKVLATAEAALLKHWSTTAA